LSGKIFFPESFKNKFSFLNLIGAFSVNLTNSIKKFYVFRNSRRKITGVWSRKYFPPRQQPADLTSEVQNARIAPIKIDAILKRSYYWWRFLPFVFKPHFN